MLVVITPCIAYQPMLARRHNHNAVNTTQKEHSSIIQEQKERKQEVKDIQDAIDKVPLMPRPLRDNTVGSVVKGGDAIYFILDETLR